MPITQKQLDSRQHYIGASDVPAILGICPYRNQKDIWLEKSGMLDGRRESGEEARWGTVFEDPIIAEYERTTGQTVQRNVEAVHPVMPFFMSHLDFVVDDSLHGEVKTSGITGPVYGSWGDDADSIPAHIVAQVQAQFACRSYENIADLSCVVLALLGGRGLKEYIVRADAELIGLIEREVDAFWQTVKSGVAPIETAHMDVSKMVRREPKSVTKINGELLNDWLEKKALLVQIAKDEADAKAAVLDSLGPNEAGTTEDGRAVTYYETARGGYIVQPTTYRTLRYCKKGLKL